MAYLGRRNTSGHHQIKQMLRTAEVKTLRSVAGIKRADSKKQTCKRYVQRDRHRCEQVCENKDKGME